MQLTRPCFTSPVSAARAKALKTLQPYTLHPRPAPRGITHDPCRCHSCHRVVTLDHTCQQRRPCQTVQLPGSMTEVLALHFPPPQLQAAGVQGHLRSQDSLGLRVWARLAQPWQQVLILHQCHG